MAINLLVLDWSGVVSNDFPILYKSVNNVLRKFHKPVVSVEELRTDFRPHARDFYADRGILDYALVKKHHYDLFEKENPDIIPLAGDAVKELSKLVTIAVFSSHPTHFLLGDISRYGLDDYIEYAFGGADKGKKEDFQGLLSVTGVLAEEILYAGDTVIDVNLAKLIGVSSIGVVNPEYGYQLRAQVEKAKPTHGIVCQLKDVIPIVRKLTQHQALSCRNESGA